MRRSRPAVARRLSIRAPAPAPAPPANRISSRRHCVPATLKRIRFSRCENDAFLPRARPAPAGRGRIARRRTPTDPILTLSLHFYHITTSPTTTNRTRQPTTATILTDPVHRLSLFIAKCSYSITVDKFRTRCERSFYIFTLHFGLENTLKLPHKKVQFKLYLTWTWWFRFRKYSLWSHTHHLLTCRNAVEPTCNQLQNAL